MNEKEEMKVVKGTVRMKGTVNEWREKAKDLTEFAKERIIDATNEGKRVAETLREELEDDKES